MYTKNKNAFQTDFTNWFGVRTVLRQVGPLRQTVFAPCVCEDTLQSLCVNAQSLVLTIRVCIGGLKGIVPS